MRNSVRSVHVISFLYIIKKKCVGFFAFNIKNHDLSTQAVQAGHQQPRKFLEQDALLKFLYCRLQIVEPQVEGGEGEEGERGTGLGLGKWTGLCIGLKRQLPGSSSTSLLAPPLPFPPPAPCPSSPSEFSSISWMRGGMEPGISIFSVITRSAPKRKRFREKVSITALVE